MKEEVFFELLRFCLDADASELRILSEYEWDHVFETASRHSLLGISYLGVQKYVEEFKSRGIAEEKIIPESIYLKWLGTAVMILQRNELMDEYCNSVHTMFREGGFYSCILKGRGVARYYGELSPYRMSGDIDVWVWPEGEWTQSHDARMKAVISFLSQICKCESPCYHHIEFKMPEKVVVEVHYTPSWMFSPIKNHRLQKWFTAQAPAEMQNDFSSLEFNRIYILLHIFRHFFFEGIGLRQVVDYFFVLRAKILTDAERQQTLQLLKSFGLARFAAALMWILRDKLGLSLEYLLCEPNEKEGRFLLSEILQAGNFGHYDKRLDHNFSKSMFASFKKHIFRNIHFITHYPSEVIWCPFWKVWHQLWLHFKTGS